MRLIYFIFEFKEIKVYSFHVCYLMTTLFVEVDDFSIKLLILQVANIIF